MISTNLTGVHSDIRGEIFYEALAMEKRGEKVLKLNTGNPAAFGFKMPDSIKQALVENIDKATGYCDLKGMPAARESLCAYHTGRGIKNITPDDIFITNGVSEAAYMAITALCSPKDEILVPRPCYSLWVNMIRLCGGNAVFYDCDEENDWQPSLESIRQNITPKTKAILLINPNNPTGAVYSKEMLESICQIARENKLVILSDEIYDRLVYEGATHISTAPLADDLLILTFNGLSKSHCICGLRCGWMVVSGPDELKAPVLTALVTIASIRLCSNATMQLAIPAAMADTAYTNDMIGTNGRLFRQRAAALAEIEKIDGLEVVPNHAAFYLFPKFDLKRFGFTDDKDFTRQLLRQQKVLVVAGSGFYAKDTSHFRIVCLQEETQLAETIARIGQFLKER